MRAVGGDFKSNLYGAGEFIQTLVLNDSLEGRKLQKMLKVQSTVGDGMERLLGLGGGAEGRIQRDSKWDMIKGGETTRRLYGW